MVLVLAQLLVYGGSVYISTRKVFTLELLSFTIFPTLDWLSDVLYIVVVPYYSEALFGFSVLFFFFPGVLFAHTIAEKQLYPHVMSLQPPSPPRMTSEKWFWIGFYEDTSNPAIAGRASPCTCGGIWRESMWKGCLFFPEWIYLCVRQMMDLILFCLCLVINVFRLSLLFLLGMFLFQCKTICNKRVWDLWCHMWTGNDTHQMDHEIDVSNLNKA
jgi:hypothetical protein